MEPLEFADLPDGALLLVDSPPIIYFLEGHPQFAKRFRPLFEAHAAGEVRFAVTTITIAEVLMSPLRAADEAPQQRGGLSPATRTGACAFAPECCGGQRAAALRPRSSAANE